ncbi:ATP-dependent RNA helicase HrpB [Pirellula sp. SH-Sr6A]|uniref:ATP-dependent helicase HrpB n=1 Tax=Pirellula sp. SH-Sr6A TaxID=1632865 RepID=UPI00078E45F5|nr:ATP-dependent helicase HrpB [Pirellula sp. SH-Sr6A]AMV30965.1 ATP-dependent RNA helicase HrpB [Pirellula sp. SH-Sr6A]
MQPLPIDSYLHEILDAVRGHPIVVVEAPPGSGKTTRVAPSLLEMISQSGTSGRIYLLQPRRLAARSVAERIAQESASTIGERIGYQVRFDHQISRNTQLIVATEGILLRRLQSDPALEDVSIVLLDEFHERSLDADLLLGMLRRVQDTVREDLRIVIMSATLDIDLIRESLGEIPIIRIESRTFPVRNLYKPMNPRDRMVDHLVRVVSDSVQQYEGDILAFLPGAGEIHRAAEELNRTSVARDCDVLPLYGAMTLEEQSRVVQTGPRRKVVLATNIAETSLTIEGVRVVVDSGQARVMRFTPDVGLDRLCLESISQASATQRAGRAGRVAPGTCIRLWSEAADRAKAAHLEPEIRRLDLCSAALQLYAWGEGESEDFPWLEKPREDAWAAAKKLLECLGAISHGKITPIGIQMSQLPIHPRLARMVLDAAERGCLSRSALLAAMLAERDPFDRREQRDRSPSIHTKHTSKWFSDCMERLLILESALHRQPFESPFGELNFSALRTIASAAEQISTQTRSLLERDRAHDCDQNTAPEAILQSLLAGFPDRLARRRQAGKSNGLMVGGKGVSLHPQSGVLEPEFFLCIEMDGGKGSDAIVRQASGVEVDWILDKLVTSEECFFHPSQKQVVARKQTRWLDLVLQETPTAISDNAKAKAILMQGVRQYWDQAYPKDDESLCGFIERVRCLREWMPELELPEIGLPLLEEVAEELCDGRRSLSEIRNAPWLDWLRAKLTPEQLQAIEREAPARIQVPSGSQIKIEYEQGKPPVLAVKIQEVFSWRATPRIARGRVPLLLHLLSPAMRPQQITDDLASFWANGYPEVKKELKRRYPKHSWPDDPANAEPGRK